MSAAIFLLLVLPITFNVFTAAFFKDEFISAKAPSRSFIIKNKRGMPFVVRKSRKGGFVDRVSRSGKRYKAARSQFLYGPSLADLYGRRKSLLIIGKVIDEDYENELDKQFNNQFEKKRR